MVLNYIRIREASVKAVEPEKTGPADDIDRACKNGSVPEESPGAVT